MENLPKDYFLDIDDELLNFLEKQGEDCIRELHQSNMVNKENSYKLLNILIVGIGSSFLLLAQKQPPIFLSAGMATFTLCWALCAIYLVFCGLSIQIRGLVSSSPHLLYTEAYKAISQEDFDYLKGKGFSGECNRTALLRRYRLNNLCKTSAELRVVNAKISSHLKRARIATVLAPVLSMLVSAVTYHCF
ncbi:hypothetical protein SODG_001741 [Sodalis praecaptivus]